MPIKNEIKKLGSFYVPKYILHNKLHKINPKFFLNMQSWLKIRKNVFNTGRLWCIIWTMFKFSKIWNQNGNKKKSFQVIKTAQFYLFWYGTIISTLHYSLMFRPLFFVRHASSHHIKYDIFYILAAQISIYFF